MLLTIEADDPEFSFLLHKHPSKVHTDKTTFGQVHVFYPNPNKVALLLEIDPLKLTKRGGSSGFALQPYVNDRPYAATSFLSVALNQMFRTAVAGRCNKRPELVDKAFQLKVEVPSLPSRGGESLLRKLFEPLGYTVEAQRIALDKHFPEWGESRYFRLSLQTQSPLHRVLRHLYILMPVLDNEKHYWVGEDEVDKLLRTGQDWLTDHPEKDLIVNRYLKFRRELTRSALAALREDEVASHEEGNQTEETVEKKLGLHEQRLNAVAELVAHTAPGSVADLGCGEGKLLRRLVNDTKIPRIIGMDVCPQSLERAESSLERLHPRKRERIELLHGSLLYDDERLHDLKVAVLVEVIEHIEPDRLERVATNLFQRMRPETVVVTTPNREYNVLWESLPGGRFRHSDHRFEWTRQEFQKWAEQVKADYEVEFSGLGEAHPEHGAPSQMAVFRR